MCPFLGSWLQRPVEIHTVHKDLDMRVWMDPCVSGVYLLFLAVLGPWMAIHANREGSKQNCYCMQCKTITENLSGKQEDCNLSKVSQFRELTFWLLAGMLQCSAEAEQAPVDNHLLCGGEQGEMEQMALFIVLFCRGCFLWIRNALLNAKLGGRGEANWSPPALRSSSGKGLLLCVCSNSRVTGEFCSFINMGDLGDGQTTREFHYLIYSILSLSPSFFSPSLTRLLPHSLADMPKLMRSDSVVPANNQEKDYNSNSIKE